MAGPFAQLGLTGPLDHDGPLVDGRDLQPPDRLAGPCPFGEGLRRDRDPQLRGAPLGQPPGDRVTMTMAYGRFTYLVEKTRVVAPSQVGVLTAVRGRERIVLTACHPLYSAAQRIVVFARLSRAIPLGVAA